VDCKNIRYFDCHADTLSMCTFFKKPFRENDGHVDLVRGLAFDHYAQFFSVFADGKGSSDVSDWYDKTMANMKAEFAANADAVQLCTTAAGADKARRDAKVAAFIDVEGAELLGCSEEKLESAYADGVRLVGLTWNHDNDLAGSCFTGTKKGLSEKGKAFVRKAQQLGVIVDLSHSSEETFWDCADILSVPMIASHSNSAAVYEHKRSLTDDQFRYIIKCGGVSGINLYDAFVGKTGDMKELVSHIEHFCALGGEKNVAIGADWDGMERAACDMKGIQDVPMLYEELLRLGYGEDIVRGIFYDNIMRVVQTVCVM